MNIKINTISREKECVGLTPVSGAKITPKKKTRRKDKTKDRCGAKTPPTCLSENPEPVCSTGNDIAREKIIVSTPEKKSPKSRKHKRLKRSKAVVLDLEV